MSRIRFPLSTTLHASVYHLSKNLLKKLLNEEQYSYLRKTYSRVKRRPLPGFLCALPDFIILGAMKCGTSSLYFYLASHPQVLTPTRKEIHFFDNNFEKGDGWYRSHFPAIAKMKFGGYVTGEASPYYLYHPHVAGRIYRKIPSVKLIALLRNPVDRAISHYWHQVNKGREDLPMEEAFEVEKERINADKERLKKEKHYYGFNHRHYSYLDRGNYVGQIERFERRFSSDQILILKSEELFFNTKETIEDVEDFLGIEKAGMDVGETRNKGEYGREAPKCVRDRLTAYYRDQMAQIEEKYGIRFE